MAAYDPQSHVIPYDTEKPTPILFWDPLEMIVAMSSLGLFIAVGFMSVGVLIAAFVLWGAKELKKGAKRGAAQHAIWAHGLPVDPIFERFFAPSYDNDFIE